MVSAIPTRSSQGGKWTYTDLDQFLAIPRVTRQARNDFAGKHLSNGRHHRLSAYIVRQSERFRKRHSRIRTWDQHEPTLPQRRSTPCQTFRAASSEPLSASPGGAARSCSSTTKERAVSVRAEPLPANAQPGQARRASTEPFFTKKADNRRN